MGFKSIKSYNEEKFGGLFVLRNDNDYADVVFLYRNVDDVLVAPTHYIKSADYSGYVHCREHGCPACSKNIRVQTKLFIPLYNINDDEVQFWDRNMRFENQLMQDVFSKFPNPSEFVFRITRHGAANDINTTYEIRAVGNNRVKSYDAILSEKEISLPDYYSTICRDVPSTELSEMLNSSNSGNSYNSSDSNIPDYTPTPRATVSTDNVTGSGANIPEPLPDDLPDSTDEELSDDVNF